MRRVDDIKTIVALTTLVASGAYTLQPDDGDKVTVEVVNASGQTIDQFEIQVSMTGSDWHTFLAGTDFDSTTNSNMLFSSTTGPHELADAGRALILMRLPVGVRAVRARVALAASTGNVTVQFGFGPGV